MPKLLLDLPPELTEYICALTVTEPFGAYVNPKNGEVGAAVLTRDEQPGITCVNKRLRCESLNHFYRNNEFIIDMFGRDGFNRQHMAMAQEWMDRLDGRNVRHMQRVLFRGAVQFTYESDVSTSRWNSRLLAKMDLAASKMSIEWSPSEDLPAEAFVEAQKLEEAFAEAMLRRKGSRVDYGCLRGLLEVFVSISGGGDAETFESLVADGKFGFAWARKEILESCKLAEARSDIVSSC